MEKGKVIFLNGTSSSGKTTLAWMIQDLANEPYYHISQDMFCEIGRGIIGVLILKEYLITRYH